MIIRFALLLPVLLLLAETTLFAQISPRPPDSDHLDFSRLPGDDRVCEWLRVASPTFDDVYETIVKRPPVEGISFKTVPHEKLSFSELGVFFVDGVLEIRLSDDLRGAERVRTLAFEVANAYLNEEHRQIDAGAANGFFTAREFAIAHEIYEYEAWRLYRRVLIDLEKKLGEGNLPSGLFYGLATVKVADYALPPLNDFLTHMEASHHMQHYLDWYQKHYANRRSPSLDARQTDEPREHE